MSSRQLYPALDAATEAALRASIKRFGVLVPPTVDQHGEIIDGHHRARIAGEIGVEFAPSVRQVADEDEAREIARTLNEDRRMLTREQRLPVVVALREDGHSLRAIGGALGVSDFAVRQDIKKAGAIHNAPAETTGLDGKTYPAAKPKPEPNGRRGYRKAKDAPFEAATNKQLEIANGHKRRLVDALSEINGICRGLRDHDLGIAAAACDPQELKTWTAKAGELSRALANVQKRLKEISNGTAT